MWLLSEVLSKACLEALERGMFDLQHFYVSYKFQNKSPVANFAIYSLF